MKLLAYMFKHTSGKSPPLSAILNNQCLFFRVFYHPLGTQQGKKKYKMSLDYDLMTFKV